jgi:hypothetical protein
VYKKAATASKVIASFNAIEILVMLVPGRSCICYRRISELWVTSHHIKVQTGSRKQARSVTPESEEMKIRRRRYIQEVRRAVECEAIDSIGERNTHVTKFFVHNAQCELIVSKYEYQTDLCTFMYRT